MADLLCIKGFHAGVRVEIHDVVRIGRAEDNTISLPDGNVSRYHTEISKRGRAVLVRDLESTNGTYVNGEKITQERPLLKNDELTIGSTTFVYNSDFDVKNAVFTDKQVYLYPSRDDTLLKPEVEESFNRHHGRVDEAIKLLDQATGLITCDAESFPELLEKMIDQMGALFAARNALIMLSDEVSGELQPMVVWGKEGELSVSKQITHSVFTGKKSVLAAECADPTTDDAHGARDRSIICAPLMRSDLPIGLVYIEREEEDSFSLKDLHLLTILCRLMGVSITRTKSDEARPEQRRRPREDSPIVGNSPALKSVLEIATKVAEHPTPVLLTGDTGTGKELVAKEIHRLSPRAQFSFVALNCAAIPRELFESELFGHEKGSFTGAHKLHRGKIEIAHGGTLFLDEIGELSLDLQPKLLRFLQEQIFCRVGGNKPIKADVRIIVATNQTLEELVTRHEFREDLFFRISVLKIHIPPLRERKEDIKLLAEYFVDIMGRRVSKPDLSISNEAIDLLMRSPWPGNVRELENCIERAVILCDGNCIQPEHLSTAKGEGELALRDYDVLEKTTSGMSADTPLSLKEVEKAYITEVLERCRWNHQKATEVLGIHRNTLRNKIIEYDLRKPR